MYVSSVSDLGRFYVPEYIRENFVPHVRYLPEPPAPIRGAMNPWQQERQRVLWMAEEASWKKIQGLQREWAQLESTMARLVTEYNNAVVAINARMEALGKKSPLQQMSAYSTYVGFIPGFKLLAAVMFVAGFLEKGIKQIFGITAKKKKDLDNWLMELQRIQARMTATQQRMEAVIDEVMNLVKVAETVASQQMVQAQADVEKSEVLYAQRQEQERVRGQRRQALYRQLTFLPRQPTSDVL